MLRVYLFDDKLSCLIYCKYQQIAEKVESKFFHNFLRTSLGCELNRDVTVFVYSRADIANQNTTNLL